MTRVAYFDLIGGVAGDMLLAALIDAGADRRVVFDALASLPIAHRRPALRRVSRAGIRALHLTGSPATGQSPRSLEAIGRVIGAGNLPESVAERAREVFGRLADAESRAHGRSPAEVRLHEAGDDDAIFDVVGVLLAMRDLGVDDVVSSPVPLGAGRSKSGFPWPGPATLELLRDIPVAGPPPAGEATTPTGAALVSTLARSFGAAPSMTLERIGYGAGSRSVPGIPNVLRILIGEAASIPGWDVEHGLRVIEANLDDLSPQLVADAVGALFEAGALDVWVTPIQMKRGRLAVTLSALVDAARLDRVSETFFAATTTLGIRHYPVERAVLHRRTDTVRVRGEDVRIKRGSIDGRLTTSMPEHADLERLASRTGETVRRLWEEAASAALDGRGASDAATNDLPATPPRRRGRSRARPS